MADGGQSLRIDRWLHFCRFFKTRSKATAAVTGGHVRLNGERTTPGTRVKIGDQIDVLRDRLQYALEVTAIPTRRGPASEAQSCYVEDDEVVRLRITQTEALKRDRRSMPMTEGRPDKRTRRKLIGKRRT